MMLRLLCLLCALLGLLALRVTAMATAAATNTVATEETVAATQRAPDDWWVALANDRAEQIHLWLAQGVSPNVVTDAGMPALMQAVRENAWRSVDLLLAHPQLDPNATNANGETALMYLAIVGDTDRAERLIERGAKINRLGWTPLHYAAARAHLALMQRLLAHQAMVNAPAPDGTSPLMMAAYSGNRAAVEVLLAAGADLLMHNREGRSAVDWALSARHDELARQLEKWFECVAQHRHALRKEGVDATPADLNTHCGATLDRDR